MTSRSCRRRRGRRGGPGPEHPGHSENNVLNPVTVARDGAEALTMLFGDDHREQGNPAVVLLDLKLPKVGGPKSSAASAPTRGPGSFPFSSSPPPRRKKTSAPPSTSVPTATSGARRVQRIQRGGTHCRPVLAPPQPAAAGPPALSSQWWTGPAEVRGIRGGHRLWGRQPAMSRGRRTRSRIASIAPVTTASTTHAMVTAGLRPSG